MLVFKMATVPRNCRTLSLALWSCVILCILVAFLKSREGSSDTDCQLRLKQLQSATAPEQEFFHSDEVNTLYSRSRNISRYLTCVDPEWKGAVQDTLCMKRPDYLASYKNPCWLDWTEQTRTLRCLPYFHLLGVDKSGTTDLYSRNAKHPHVESVHKEIYYWCWGKYGQRMKRTLPSRPFGRYLAWFDRTAVIIDNITDSTGYHYIITGDGTPMDFWDFRAWPLIPQNRGLNEPVVLTPHLMRHLYRQPKFIVILRNPVDRLYSDYLFMGDGASPDQFQRDVPRAVDMMEECLRYNTTRQCVFSNHTYVAFPMRLHIGMYSVFMKEWLSVFPRETFYILRTEDYSANVAHYLQEICRFLDLEPLPDETLTKIVQADRKHETKAKKRVADMFPDTRELLTKFYSRYNEELAVMLEDTRFLWQES